MFESENVTCSVVSDSATPCMNYRRPGSSVHGILQARILEWVAIPFSTGSSPPRVQTRVCCIADRFFTVMDWQPYPVSSLVQTVRNFIQYLRWPHWIGSPPSMAEGKEAFSDAPSFAVYYVLWCLIKWISMLLSINSFNSLKMTQVLKYFWKATID